MISLPENLVQRLQERFDDVMGPMGQEIQAAPFLMNQCSSPRSRMPEHIGSILDAMRASLLLGNSSAGAMEQAVLELFSTFIKNRYGKEGRKPEFDLVTRSKMHDVKDIITSSFTDSHSLLDLAHAVGTNDCTLKAAFKREFGTTVFEYIFNLRMDMACSYLLDTSLPIAEIGFKLGFDSPPHFATAFRRRFGMTPTDFRLRRERMKR